MNKNQLGRPRHTVIGWAIIAIAIIAVVAVGAFAFFAPRPSPEGFYPFPFFHPFGWFFGLFWLFIIFWAVRWLFWPRRWGYGRSYWRYGDESYYILRERYAKGEITKEQFEQMMRDLREHS